MDATSVCGIRHGHSPGFDLLIPFYVLQAHECAPFETTEVPVQAAFLCCAALEVSTA